MAKYRMKWNYRSAVLGPFVKGQVVELSEEMAAWLERDSPGALENLSPQPPSRSGKGERAMEAAPKDRMVRGASKRAEVMDGSEAGYGKELRKK